MNPWSESKFASLVANAKDDLLKVIHPNCPPAVSLNYAEELIKAFEREVPFQNISLVGVPNEKRNILTEERALQAMLEKRGNLCFHMNGFLKNLFASLGFPSPGYFAATVYHFPPLQADDESFGCHNIVALPDLAGKGSLSVCDVGFGAPGMGVLPLDFSGYSPVYTTPWGLDYRFKKEPNKDGKELLVREHRHIPWMKLSPEEKENFVRISAADISHQVTGKYLADAVYRMIYCPESDAGIGRGLFATRTTSDNRQVLVRGKQKYLLKGLDDFELQILCSKEEIAAEFEKILPNEPAETIKTAIKNHESFFKPFFEDSSTKPEERVKPFHE